MKNPDEFDDSVIAHEFFHHVAKCLGVDDSPTGNHELHQRLVPRFAWSERLATGLGQHILKSSQFRDRHVSLEDNQNVWAVVDVEIRSNPNEGHVKGADVGTADGSMSGKVGKVLVASVLWDLLDPAVERQSTSATQADGDAEQTEDTSTLEADGDTEQNSGADAAQVDNDGIDCTVKATVSALTGYLGSKHWSNRGAPKRDLVDFLDGWRCYAGRDFDRRELGASVAYQALDQLLLSRDFHYQPPKEATKCD